MKSYKERSFRYNNTRHHFYPHQVSNILYIDRNWVSPFFVFTMTPIPPSITTGISNYEETGHGDPLHKMKALTWQAPNQVKLRKECNCLTLVNNY